MLTQAPLQFVVPGPQVSVHAPPEQTLFTPHAAAHPPQFAGSLCVLTHTPAQSVKPPLHAMAHTPPEQVAAPFAGTGHTTEQPPQLSGSFEVDRHLLAHAV